MPPLPNVPGVIKVQIKGVFSSGYNWANVCHFTYGGSPPSIASCNTFANQVYDDYSGQFTPIMSSHQSMTEVIITDLSSPTSAEGVFLQDTAGTSSGEEIPGNACFLVSKLVLARYRGGHPRTYLPVGTQVNLQDQGHWNSAFVTTCTDGWTNWVGTFIGSTAGSTTIGQECAVSYYTTDYTVEPHKRIRRDVPVVYDIPVDGYTGNAEIASQRRRIGRKR